jgi:UDP-N-acetyl-D-galactosamine dehydrogenase
LNVENFKLEDQTIAVIGLGYVGLPLALAFAQRLDTVGFDINPRRVAELQSGRDGTRSADAGAFAAARRVRFTSSPDEIAGRDVYIVTVPTPVDAARIPDFGPLLGACRAIGGVMKSGAVVVFESTVYPGATEEVCVPELERCSGLRWKRDFHVGYSPERVNPGDRQHTLQKIVKLVAGDRPEITKRLAALYGSIIEAGIYEVDDIRTAEAAKVIENTQRDINIALINELAILFGRMGLDTRKVLDAAGTKWNFLKFSPGLVGGHCIGVDPYYLTYQAQKIGYHPEIILAGRRINDGMGRHVAQQTVRKLAEAGAELKGGRVNILGATFKEDCPDLRNSQVFGIAGALEEFGLEVRITDPAADPGEAEAEYGRKLVPTDALPPADAVVLAVAHSEFLRLPAAWYLGKLRRPGVVVDVKSALDPGAFLNAGVGFWRL